MTMICASRDSARRISTFCCSAVRSAPGGATCREARSPPSRRVPRTPCEASRRRMNPNLRRLRAEVTRSPRPSAAGRGTAPARSPRRRARAPPAATGTRLGCPSRSIWPSSAASAPGDDAARASTCPRRSRRRCAWTVPRATASETRHRAPGRPQSASRRSGARGAPRSCAHRQARSRSLARPLRLELRGVRPA